MWKKLKHIFMAGDTQNYSQIRIPLQDHEILLLLRYIEAEKQEPDFIKKGLADNFQLEVLYFAYFASHGASDSRQHILLNEREVNKIFWPAEERIKQTLGISGSNCKSIAVFDCCREDIFAARERIVKAQSKLGS